MSYNFSYEIYASEILRELHKSKDPQIVDKFINELKKQDNLIKNGCYTRYIGEYVLPQGVKRVIDFVGNGV